MIAKMDIKPASVLLGMALAVALLEAKKMVDKRREGYACCGASA